MDFEVISAHRNPDRLEEASASIGSVIAGAVFQHTCRCGGFKGYGSRLRTLWVLTFGLDSVMSIQMMPRGVPVLSCGPTTWHLFVLLNRHASASTRLARCVGCGHR